MDIPKVTTKRAITGSFLVHCPICRCAHFLILKDKQIALLEGSVPDSHRSSIDMVFDCPEKNGKFEIVKLER